MGKIEEIAEIHHKCLLEEFKMIGIEVNISLKYLKEKWKQNQDNVRTFTEDNKVLGFITTDTEPMIYVDSEYQRKGIGSTLLKTSNVKSVWVMKGNDKAEKFYYKNGFQPTELRVVSKLGYEIMEMKWVRDERT